MPWVPTPHPHLWRSVSSWTGVNSAQTIIAAGSVSASFHQCDHPTCEPSKTSFFFFLKKKSWMHLCVALFPPRHCGGSGAFFSNFERVNRIVRVWCILAWVFAAVGHNACQSSLFGGEVATWRTVRTTPQLIHTTWRRTWSVFVIQGLCGRPGQSECCLVTDPGSSRFFFEGFICPIPMCRALGRTIGQWSEQKAPQPQT